MVYFSVTIYKYVPIEQLDIQIEKENATVTAHRYDGDVRYCFINVEGIWLVDDIETIRDGEEGRSERKAQEKYIREQTGH